MACLVPEASVTVSVATDVGRALPSQRVNEPPEILRLRGIATGTWTTQPGICSNRRGRRESHLIGLGLSLAI